uniref:GTD-binding domain-containing protein n=1 Tax=Oryza meridionalis TaxID=40149 RepID=A0A0E0EGN7_9ORYZ
MAETSPRNLPPPRPNHGAPLALSIASPPYLLPRRHASSSSSSSRHPMIGMEVEVEDDMVEWYRCGGGGAGSAAVEVRELRVELEVERRMRRKAEAVSEVLAAELEEERRRRGAAEAECRRMRGEVGEMRAEVERALEEVDDERRMLRVAELWREERVQMKLADAKAAMEEALREIAAASAATAIADDENSSSSSGGGGGSPTTTGKSSPTSQQISQATTSGGQPQLLHRREVAGGGENPHIARGIKGFVEFPRAVRVRPPREERVDLVSNLECQRAQLRALSRHRNPPAGVGLAAAAASNNLVL